MLTRNNADETLCLSGGFFRSLLLLSNETMTFLNFLKYKLLSKCYQLLLYIYINLLMIQTKYSTQILYKCSTLEIPQRQKQKDKILISKTLLILAQSKENFIKH